MVAKAWALFNGVGTVTILAQQNIASIIRVSVGTYTITFTTPMSSSNYAGLLSSTDDASGATQILSVFSGLPKTAESFSINLFTTGGGYFSLDAAGLSVLVFSN